MNTTTEQRYRKALHICSANLSGAQDVDPKESALCFFRMGVVLGRMGDIGGAIRCFNDAFILRDMTEEQGRSNLWRQFHDIQMAIYILGKRNKTLISLAEGDMVHDLIKYRWRLLQREMDRSEIPFAGSDMKAWFRTVKIDFPWEMEDMDGLLGSPDDQDSFIDPMECVKITR